ncbi:MAG: tRNA lysidine(34) synthetase TilS [Rhodocyclales bacterium]|nr:tRNA lysidine(34) synthetase TilS [Rhodocyclales bacterium]
MAAGARPVVGLSGGIDSVVLLHVAKSLGRPIAALHVHHGLSPDANRWADFCRSLCDSWAIPLQVARVDVERGSADGLEGAARRARHQVYADVAADWILLGHHRGDRAETMLFNLLRGAGVRGAGAMRECSGRLLRPLLDVGRAEIAGYATEHELRWVDDHSNADTRYSRNFLRHGILPAIQPRFPAVEQRLASAAARFAEAADLLDDLARLDLGQRAPSFPIDIECLAALPEPRARNVLRYLLSRHGVGIPSEERLAEALRQCLAAAPDRHPALAFGRHVMRRKAGRILLDPA